MNSSNLADLAQSSRRYHNKRSPSPSGSSSSGYGSILSDSEDDLIEPEEHTNNNEPHYPTSKPVQSYDGHHPRLDISNKGMKLLMKMGWTEGSGLGASNNGRKDPIPTPAQTPLLGLGKATQDAYMLSNAIAKPKELESLVIARETDEGRLKREEKVKVVQMREEEREDRLRTFHCSVCDKGYTNITQFEEHERSYAHHHARRALEARQAQKAGKPSSEVRLDKERRREARELERLAKAAGVTVQTTMIRQTTDLASKSLNKSTSASTGGGFKKVGQWNTVVDSISSDGPKPKSGGWAPVSIQNVPQSQTETKPKSSGFVPISQTSTSTVENPVTTHLRHPSFVRGSVSSTPLQEPLNPAKTSEATVKTSKFAQIAARLAAQRAAGGLATNNKSSVVKSKGDDLELMLEENGV